MFVSAEIRWFYPDECPANLHRWFGEMSPAPGGGKLRIDVYLSQTNQSEVSIKIRGGRPGVEIKGLVTVCRSELVPFAPERIEDKVIALGDVSDSIGDRPPRA